MKNVGTYAEVDRRTARMKREGVHPAKIATYRAQMVEQVAARYQAQKRQRASVPVPDTDRLDMMRDDAASAYGIKPRELYDRKHGPIHDARRCGAFHPITCARRAFVVAAREVGYSTTELAMYLRRPGSHSSIIYMTQTATDDDRAVAKVLVRRDKERQA